jgi:hypothetical protein
MIAQVIDVSQLAPLRPEVQKGLEARYRLHSKADFDKVAGMVRGLQESFLALGAFTILSTLVFSSMKAGKGADRARTSMRRH